MRCPDCGDEYDDGVRLCAHCRVPLVAGTDDPAPAAPPRADASLGRFHPAVAQRIGQLLDRRGIGHETITEEDAVRVVVDGEWRDDLRAELTTTWSEVVRLLPEEQAAEVLADGGPAPGWYDSPRGGHVDRDGRLVVSVEAEDEEQDAARVIGPALLTVGAILVVVGWYVLDSAAVTFAGIALGLTGLLVPR